MLRFFLCHRFMQLSPYYLFLNTFDMCSMVESCIKYSKRMMIRIRNSDWIRIIPMICFFPTDLFASRYSEYCNWLEQVFNHSQESLKYIRFLCTVSQYNFRSFYFSSFCFYIEGTRNGTKQSLIFCVGTQSTTTTITIITVNIWSIKLFCMNLIPLKLLLKISQSSRGSRNATE